MSRKKVIFRGALAGDEHYSALDYDTSAKIGVEVRARAKECYMNAMRAAHCVGASSIVYVEGYAFLSDVPELGVEHGWLLCDGRVVDPTVAAFDAAPYSRYRPVVVWSASDMVLQVLEQESLPLSLWPCRWKEGMLTVAEVAGAWRAAFLETFDAAPADLSQFTSLPAQWRAA